VGDRPTDQTHRQDQGAAGVCLSVCLSVFLSLILFLFWGRGTGGGDEAVPGGGDEAVLVAAADPRRWLGDFLGVSEDPVAPLGDELVAGVAEGEGEGVADGEVLVGGVEEGDDAEGGVGSDVDVVALDEDDRAEELVATLRVGPGAEGLHEVPVLLDGAELHPAARVVVQGEGHEAVAEAALPVVEEERLDLLLRHQRPHLPGGVVQQQRHRRRPRDHRRHLDDERKEPPACGTAATG